MTSLSAALRIILHLLIIRPAMKILFGFHVEGRRHLQNHHQYIIAANHNSHLDILLIFAIIPVRMLAHTRPVAARDYFQKNKIFFNILEKTIRPIWIDRNDTGGGSLVMDQIHSALAENQNIVIFPEGTRGIPGEIQEFRKGIGKIAQLAPDVPIIPVYLSGSEKALPRNSRIPLPVWHQIQIAPPLRWQGSVESVTLSVKKRISELAELDDSQKHHRKPKPIRNPQVIAVLGIDGSGKSTVSQLLAKSLSKTESSIQVSDELVRFEHGENSLLQPLTLETLRKRINRYAKHARNLKHYKIPKLAELYMRDALMGQIRRWYRPGSIILDGSPLLNLTSWMILYKEELFDRELCRRVLQIMSKKTKPPKSTDPLLQKLPELKLVLRLHLPYMSLPDKIIFLNTDPRISMSRIDSRGEQKQAHESRQKLTKLQSAYHLVCGILEEDFHLPVCIINGNQELDPIMKEVDEFVNPKPSPSSVQYKQEK